MISIEKQTTMFIMPNNDVTVTANFEMATGAPEETRHATSLLAWIRDGLLHVSGLTVGETLSVYSAGGALVHRSVAASGEADIPLVAQGIYLVQSSGNIVKVVCH